MKWETMSIIEGIIIVILSLEMIFLSRRTERAEKQAGSLLKGKRLLLQKIEQFKQLSTEDPLTGLGNRRRLDAALRDVHAAALRARFPKDESQIRSFPIALVVFDLDRFKQVNDNLGHDAGDKVLRKIGLAIKEHLRRTDICARPGGDEFVILLTDIVDENVCINIVWRISKSFQESMAYLNEERRPTLSGGLAFFQSSDIADSPEAILRKLEEADRALRDAKENGKNQLRIFGSEAESIPL